MTWRRLIEQAPNENVLKGENSARNKFMGTKLLRSRDGQGNGTNVTIQTAF
jgi:hypothetical protein